MRLFKCFFLPLLFACCSRFSSLAQRACSTLGQTPSSAFPVCGTNIFAQTIVPECGGNLIPGVCPGDGLTDQNPFWYKFTCFVAGTLGFSILPDDLGDDYDWQLFDVTGRNPDDVFTDASLFVACNWSGRFGITGASASGTGLENCAGTAYPLFSSMPTLKRGHNYLLLLSHFTTFKPGQKGYRLSFGGGTASITDTTKPAMLYAEASCDGYRVKLKLNKPMKCTSIESSGREFSLSDSTEVISATGVGCSNNFDTDSLVLQLGDSLKPGFHTLIIKKGFDHNTLIDNCDNEIPEFSSVTFQVFGKTPTLMDSLSPVTCAPQSLQLVFSKNIRCNSIAPDGSDFNITGSYAAIITSAQGFCTDGLSKIIKINLQNKLQRNGTFTIHLQKGNDGNTVIDECGEETLLPASISFSVKDTVSAQFTYTVIENCASDHIDLFNNGGSSITSWNWYFDSTIMSTAQNPSLDFSDYGNKNIKLIVTNGFCTDSVLKTVLFPHDTLVADFTGPDIYCPNELAVFADTSKGNIVEWNWQFGNGHTSNIKAPPPQTYYTTVREKLVPVSLIIKSNRNCYDTAVHNLKVVQNCHIAVPSAFTPNRDGVNDYLYPLNAYKASGLNFSVYNKFGQKIYTTKDWTIKWDGTFNGYPQPTGVYVWMLEYKDQTGKIIFLKGTSVLIR